MKMKDQDLSAFNGEFAKVAVGAKPVLGDYVINKTYASAVKPAVLCEWLAAWLDLPFQQLQAKALQLETAAVSFSQRLRAASGYN